MKGMEYILTETLCLAIGFTAGFIGTLLGIGGGSLTTPMLILSGLEPHRAVASSLIAIIGTSVGGLPHLYKHGLVKLKVALILESASVLGALIGALLIVKLPSSKVALVVAIALLISATLFVSTPVEIERRPTLGGKTSYIIAWSSSLCAGILSASAGVGGGIVKVPILVLILGLSVKVAVATSKLMVGITAATGALVYGITGHVDPYIAIPLVVGTYSGAFLSARILTRIRARKVRTLAVVMYLVLSILLILKFLGIYKIH